MQEAILKVIDFGFEQMKLEIIIAVPSGNNIKSRKLLEQNNFKLDSNLQSMLSQQMNVPNMAVYSVRKNEILTR